MTNTLSAGIYDTPHSVVAKVTYRPPLFAASVMDAVPQPPAEKDVLYHLYNTGKEPRFTAWDPVEGYLHRELCNPHGTAQKIKRYTARQAYKKRLLTEYVEAEYANLNGRNRREARAEATFKWQKKLKAEEDAERRRRWRNKTAVADMQRKAKRKARKQEKAQRRLTNLVLGEGELNQVVPIGAKVS